MLKMFGHVLSCIGSIGTSDSIMGNASTFFLEMQEMAVGPDIYVYTFIYIHNVCVCVCVCVYTHTHTHTEREQERERARARSSQSVSQAGRQTDRHKDK